MHLITISDTQSNWQAENVAMKPICWSLVLLHNDTQWYKEEHVEFTQKPEGNNEAQ